MRSALLIPVLGLALAAGAPAFAQSSSQSGSAQKSGATATQPHSQIQAMSQDKLRKQLEQAGFKNVQVLDAAYLVQAQTQDGNQVFMTINPPSSMSGGSASASGSQSGSGQSGSSQSGSNPSSGTPKQ
ncbi:hypothetical protein [Azospirillum rugosum]|uniref:Preprotein translocase subunit SecF n=1 Tax=Azospirillum rugosum TaxID=416170 RepID=A0ABS4SS54_9PROT|nr:hypothetical protein [Azospirillum rugosum]MBP2295054.1 preprotein translocase subunit SecF [Azospirillum rugosum]MDQ0528877.1 preprotein translocase subunit SecF [Azospirillum rugosum]